MGLRALDEGVGKWLAVKAACAAPDNPDGGFALKHSCRGARLHARVPGAFCLSFMKQPKQNFQEFLKSPLGTVLVFIVLFYIITFAVYWFYSPGPEENREAMRQIQTTTQSQQADGSQQNIQTNS
jgi:hypothetical protein